MRRPLLALPLLLLAFSGCGADDEQPATGTGATDTTRLEVVVTKAGPTQRLEFSCGGDSRPCDAGAIAKLTDVFQPDDPARACTELYGGPEEAHVTGTLEGRAVDHTVTRTDGCEIADYDKLFAALGHEAPHSPSFDPAGAPG
jgi:hypothetical protein